MNWTPFCKKDYKQAQPLQIDFLMQDNQTQVPRVHHIHLRSIIQPQLIRNKTIKFTAPSKGLKNMLHQ
jgi:hypothetical protein